MLSDQREADKQKSHLSLDPVKIREIARKTASDAIVVQKKEMRDFGVMADWDNEKSIYRTMGESVSLRRGPDAKHRPRFRNPAAEIIENHDRER